MPFQHRYILDAFAEVNSIRFRLAVGIVPSKNLNFTTQLSMHVQPRSVLYYIASSVLLYLAYFIISVYTYII